FSVTGGLRYTFDSVKAVGENTRFRFLPGAAGVRDQVCADTIRFKNADGTFPRIVTDPSQCHTETSTRSSRPTWLIGLEYKPVEDLMAYAKYTRGYRQGGINLTNIGIETWGPEKVDAYEIGAKVSFH